MEKSLYSFNDLVRFWSKVDIRSEDECWNWIGKSKSKDGYGFFQINYIRWYSHRLAYIIFNGVIKPKKLRVCHACDNPSCCNPKHLWLGTQKENIQDCWNKGRRNHIGENNSRSILTESEVKEIKQLLASKVKGAVIGRIYNMPKEHISSIKTGRIWKHVT